MKKFLKVALLLLIPFFFLFLFLVYFVVIDTFEQRQYASSQRNTTTFVNESLELQPNYSGYFNYLVGVEIPEGEYKIIPNGKNETSQAQISLDEEGHRLNILASQTIRNGKTHAFYFKVKNGQYLYLKSGGTAIPLIHASSYKTMNGKYVHEGQYKVGFDIPAGDYKLVCRPDKKNNSGKASITNGPISDKDVDSKFETVDTETPSKVITLSKGQYIEIRQCIIESI
ncbi:hypothetical protein [Enterococcus gilvus]|uniref:hypothetical protein n=1 Tax=Enterococcus gilvus TaxID=160453 RepID=UPI001C8C5B1D|nr:hypothetical protein [Enterococcus gilvus]MBX8938392.1 hypothetical protein [Enterococcus gilvus]